MKISKFLLFYLFVFLFVFACSGKKSEKEYYDLANQNMGQENWQEAEKYFSKILEEYPNGVNSSKALFMVAFINANYVKDLEKARKYYTEFLEKYPNHELADDAKYEIDHLGQDVDDLPFLQSAPEQTTDEGNQQTKASSIR
jgi:outer membrane protein assembly factor BamD (BamD/ComL family)